MAIIERTFKVNESVEVFVIFPKKKLNPDDMEYYSAMFCRKIKLTIKSPSTVVKIWRTTKDRTWKFYVSQKWRSFISKEPSDDWFTFELTLTKEACARVGIDFESEKEHRIEDINEFMTKLEKEAKIFVIYGSEDFTQITV